jgi:hypothetical protein
MGFAFPAGNHYLLDRTTHVLTTGNKRHRWRFFRAGDTMRKQLFDSTAVDPSAQADEVWLDLEQVAQVAVTSEDPNCPIESAFNLDAPSGWRAGGGGEQTIRLIFDPPQRVKRIWLRFIETKTERTQEFSLRWRPERDARAQELVRQQWNFSPYGATIEIEDYKVELCRVASLELTINPDVNKRDAVATLAEWRMA